MVFQQEWLGERGKTHSSDKKQQVKGRDMLQSDLGLAAFALADLVWSPCAVGVLQLGHTPYRCWSANRELWGGCGGRG